MAGKLAREGRRLRRQIKLGRSVLVVSMTDDSETYECGHSGPRGREREHGPGKIYRHCKECPPLEIPVEETYNLAQRAAEKQMSRDLDRADLESGRKSYDDLRMENAHFSSLSVKINFAGAKSLA